MPAPSPLAIATSSLNRLVKEEASYHKELEDQSARIAKLEAGEGADDENAEYILRQHVSFFFRRMPYENISNIDDFIETSPRTD